MILKEEWKARAFLPVPPPPTPKSRTCSQPKPGQTPASCGSRERSQGAEEARKTQR